MRPPARLPKLRGVDSSAVAARNDTTCQPDMRQTIGTVGPLRTADCDVAALAHVRGNN